MITIYRLFQIIMSIVLSVFVLYLLIGYAGDYAGVGRSGARQKTINVFLQDVDNVYLSGNPVNFTGFSRDDYTSCHPRPTKPPKLWCFMEDRGYESKQLLVPVFTRLGNDVLITRSSLDLGWTRLDYVEALTGMTVVFNPTENDDDTWNLIKDIAAGFPDTSGHYPKTFFDFCDGSSLLIEDAAGAPYERREFLGIIDTNRDALSVCAAPLSHNHVLVTLSPSCSQGFANSGICVSPPANGVGHAYITGCPGNYVYKDPADLAALIIGGDGRDVFGDCVGGETWEFKNQLMLGSLGTAAGFMERRCGILKQLSETRDECRARYQDFESSMAAIGDLAGSDPYDISAMTSLRAELDNARAVWDSLVNMGCESRV